MGGASGSSTASAGAGAQADGQFTLLYRDEFDHFDATRWQIMTHSWDGNLALFSQESVSVKDGHLDLSLLPAPQNTVDSGGASKSFLGAEVRSLDTLTYGRVRARIKFASGSAVVSSLVTIYTPWPADNWNELDIEHLGAQPTVTQFNTMVYTGAPVTPPVTTSVAPTQEPYRKTLDFAAGDDFHIYAVEWTPASAKFYVDDMLAYTWTKHIELMTLPQNVLLTIWASSSVAWAGAVAEETSKASASYDWIELYEYRPR
jgi:endo-1,3-1,4-beta-glycanase ExoK